MRWSYVAVVLAISSEVCCCRRIRREERTCLTEGPATWMDIGKERISQRAGAVAKLRKGAELS